MATVYLTVPPTEFERLEGDNGSYVLDEQELKKMPLGTLIEIEDPKRDRTFCVPAGVWKECGHMKDGKVYLPIEYFSKK